MITTDHLDEIVRLMLSRGLRSVELSQGGARIRMALDDAAPASSATRSEKIVGAKAIGRFMPSHPRSLGDAPVVGTSVSEGQHLGYLRNDAILLPIQSPHAGEITKLHAEAGQLLGYGAPVLTVLSED